MIKRSGTFADRQRLLRLLHGQMEIMTITEDPRRVRPKDLKPVRLKRYGRRRLYDPVRCRNLTVTDLRQWTVDGIEFVIVDSETGADITRDFLPPTR
jgi:PHB/PHA accumulation regulator DNA-binding domain